MSRQLPEGVCAHGGAERSPLIFTSAESQYSSPTLLLWEAPGPPGKASEAPGGPTPDTSPAPGSPWEMCPHV